jgi:ketosteroid isomerase-like protein
MQRSKIGLLLMLLSFLTVTVLMGSQKVYFSEDFTDGAPGDFAPGVTRTVLQEFRDALNALFIGDVGPMKEVWSHEKDVTYMGPTGGMQVGWEKVLPVWEKQAALKLKGKVECTDVHITRNENLMVVQHREKGENLDPSGKPRKVDIRATSVFRNEKGNWKMIGHHTDLIPGLQ